MMIMPERSGRSAPDMRFTRYIGYDSKSEFETFVKKEYIAAASNGLVFTSAVANPDNAEIEFLKRFVDITRAVSSVADICADVERINSSGRLNADVKLFSESVFSVLNLVESVSSNKTIVVNCYVKLMCWCIRSYNRNVKNVLYIGEASKYEVYFLYLLSMLGCKVTLISFSDTAYKLIDGSDKFSSSFVGQFLAPIQFDFSAIDLQKMNKVKAMYNTFTDKIKKTVQVVTTTAEDFPNDILMTANDRLHARDIHFDTLGIVPVFNFALIGYADMDVYKNMLYRLRSNIEKTGRPLIINEKTIPNPTPDEARFYIGDNEGTIKDVIDNLALKVNIQTDERRSALARLAFINLLSSVVTDNKMVIYNLGVKLIVWLNRIVVAQREKYVGDAIPVFIYFGDITQPELTFMHFLSMAGYDVAYITPSKMMTTIVNQSNINNRMTVFELPQTLTSRMEYPKTEVRMKVATVAYNAERELDVMMYSDGNIFRDHQFATCRSRTLKTTFEEIEILWKTEAKYRSGFETDGNTVNVPTIFAKISGVNDKNMDRYWTYICRRITDTTLIKVKTPSVDTSMHQDLSIYRNYYDKNGINIQKLKASPLNKYSYLADDKQDFIFSKMQEAVDSGLLTIQFPLQIELVMHVGLSLDKTVCRLVQKYDFTKDIPKVIVIDTIEATMTMPECIQLVLFSLMGFDILVFTPTGYKNIEAWISSNAFELHTLNDFVYDARVPKLKALPDEPEGLFDKLFKKGKK